MRIGFFGTPELSSQCCQGLFHQHEVVFVVSAEDKTCGRNRSLSWCPVKNFAMCREIDVLQPCDLDDSEFLHALAGYDADIFVVVAYGRVLPEKVYTIPPLGTINLHPSLLPKYRGAAPVQWALVNGETETGITVQRITDRLDAGDIIVQERFPVDIMDTAGDLFARVMERGPELLHAAIQSLADGTARPRVQDEAAATYCGKIDRDTSRINWGSDRNAVHNLVRGMNPKPGGWTTFRDRLVKIWLTAPFGADDLNPGPGEIIRYRKKHLLAGTGDGGCVEIVSLQPENRKVMDGISFCNGMRVTAGEFFR